MLDSSSNDPHPLSGHYFELVDFCLRVLCLPVLQVLLWRLVLQGRVRSLSIILLSMRF